MSGLLVLIGILLPHALSPPQPARHPDFHSVDDDPQKLTTRSDSESHTTTPPHTETSYDDASDSTPPPANSDSSDAASDEGELRVVPVNHNWTRVLADGCGQNGCSWSCRQDWCLWAGSGWISSILLTPDGRLVIGNWHSKTVVVVQPASARATIHLPAQPLGLALAAGPSVRVVVTCGTQEILLVDLDQAHQPVQRIPTKKRYGAITSGLTDTTLIVSSLADGDNDDVSIDVITLQGDVIQTLMDTTRLEVLRYSFSLTNIFGDVLVCAVDKHRHTSMLLRLSQSKSCSSQSELTSSQSDGCHWEAAQYADEQLSGRLWMTAAHRSGHVFVSQDDGVVVRTADGQYLRVLDQPDPYLNPTAMAVAADTLFVVWDHTHSADFVLVEYRLLGLPG